MTKLIENIDDYVWEIKTFLNLYSGSQLFYKTLYEGISAYICSINIFAKEIGSDEADNALEKLYTLQQILEIKIENAKENKDDNI